MSQIATTTATSASHEAFRIPDLPIELRLMIFTACFTRQYHRVTVQDGPSKCTIAFIRPNKLPSLHLVCRQLNTELQNWLPKRAAAHAVPRLLICKDPYHNIAASTLRADVTRNMVMLINELSWRGSDAITSIPSYSKLAVFESAAELRKLCEVISEYLASSEDEYPVEMAFWRSSIKELSETDVMHGVGLLSKCWRRGCGGVDGSVKVFDLEDGKAHEKYIKRSRIKFGGVLSQSAWEQNWA
ncbi:hypothetical protein NX059_001937 [Plenodomus lindquistii]|nr:hypothetical protein NX059_001937 [Plenodomus lindquistii]